MPDQPRLRGRPKAAQGATDQHTVQALDRALALLELIAAQPGLTLSELAQRSDQAVATVFRALATLQARRMVELEEPGQLWHIGSGAFRIGAAFLRRSAVVERARLPMEALANECGETASLGAISEDRLLYLAQVESQQAIRVAFPAGSKAPLHVTAIGKALLAWLPPDQAQAILARQGVARVTSLSLSSVDSLMRDLARSRERGFAIDDQESAEGLRAVAAPVFNAFGEPVAGLAVSAPAFRMGLSDAMRLGALVRATADRVTEATGGQRPAP